MPRISKLSKEQIEEMKACLVAGVSLQKIGTKFHIAAASVWYYKKKYMLSIASIYSLPPPPKKKKPKSYENYLRDYYKKIGKPYKKPPQGKYLYWL